MEKIQGGVTAANGFFAASCAAEIREKGKLDMAMLYSTTPCVVAGTFTKNVVKAAPVLWDQRIVEENGLAQIVVINSGIANACTGEDGQAACRDTAAEAGLLLFVPLDHVLLASTGVIGEALPMDRIRSGVDEMAKRLCEPDADSGKTAVPGADCKGIEAGTAAARAILTTDTHEKECAVTFEAGGQTVTLGGMCKGSGMIHPNMGTMLSFLTTDLSISNDLLLKALREDVVDTYNMISIDGDTSTNDTVLLLANAQAGNACITEENEDYARFVEALHFVNTELAKQIAGDGEGATALLEVKVVHAATKEEARCLSKSVVSSNLTKAMLFGHDANFGRVLCAMGYSGADFDPERVDLFFESAAGRIAIFSGGKALAFSEEEATRILSEPAVTILADMHEGEAEATAWGCDLTYDYVKINADYRS